MEKPIYRACIARAVSSCGSDIIATESGSLDCGIFSDPNLRKECRDIADMGFALRELDSSRCVSLVDWRRSNCEFSVAVKKAVKTEKPESCLELQRTNGEESGKA